MGRLGLLGIVGLSGLLFIAGCGKSDDNTSNLSDATEYLIESGVSAVSGVIDDQAGTGSFAAFSDQPKSFSTLCTRPHLETCSSGVKSMTYDNCAVGATGISLSGEVTLTYSQTDCTMAAGTNSVIRTYDYTISGPRGGSLRVFSDSAENYLGNPITGGGRLTNSGGGVWQVEILGKHRVMSFRGRTIYNHSLSSGSPLTVSGGLNRSSRVVTGGSIQIFHNLAEYTLTLEPDNLTWDGGCHPSSGSLTGTLTGSVEGTITLTYTAMGQGDIEIERPGQETVTRSFAHSYCE